MPPSVPPALDHDPMSDHHRGQDWLIAWHPPEAPPIGTPHGSSAVCIVPSGDIVLVCTDTGGWTIPGGRTEPGETWEDTLYREVAEEACASVTSASLLGWGRGECMCGQEAGKVLVRSLWLAYVELQPWQPDWEMTERILMPTNQALQKTLPYLTLAHQRMHTRLYLEAMRASDLNAISSQK